MASYCYSPSVLAETATKATIDDFLWLIKGVHEHLSAEEGTVGTLKITGKLIEVQPVGEAIIVGDLHGDLKSLVHILQESNFLGKMKNGKDVLLIFLGDYGDRGVQSPAVYYVVLKLKELFPENVILMRGNHEGPKDLRASPHDLPVHLEDKYGKRGTEAYLNLRELFSCLYTGVLIKDRCILLHGGAPSQAKTVNDLAFAHKKHPKEQHLEEILWNDPWTGITGTIASPRGPGRLFGEDVTNRLLKMFKVKALIRGHQSCPNGYSSTHNEKVITLFSRKGKPYNNKNGAYMQLNLSKNLTNPKQLLHTIHQF